MLGISWVGVEDLASLLSQLTSWNIVVMHAKSATGQSLPAVRDESRLWHCG
jgi:hypothetical protein